MKPAAQTFSLSDDDYFTDHDSVVYDSVIDEAELEELSKTTYDHILNDLDRGDRDISISTIAESMDEISWNWHEFFIGELRNF